MSLDLGAAAPSPADTHLLTAALLPDERGADAWRAWRSAVSVEDSHPRGHGLFPLVAANVSSDVLGADTATLQGLRRRDWAVRERLRVELARLTGQLAGDDCAVRPIRGSAFLVDPNSPVRPVTQLDLQVRPECWERAVRSLLATGWRPAFPRSRSDPGIVLESEGGVRLVLDWAPGFPSLLRRPLEEPGAAPGADAIRLLVAVVEGLRPPGFAPLLWPVDVSLLTARMSGDDWEVLHAAAAAAQVAPVVGAGLSWARDTLGLEVPPATLVALASGPLDARVRRRLTAYSSGVEDPDRLGRRIDMRRAARRHGVDIAVGASDAGLVSRAWGVRRSPGAHGGPGRS